ncbi:MorD protein [Ketobacter sp. MCCC 1A13808]|uniref:nitric oxide reductase activation protein NorD n=1 Tax=Ketobacter sp. MCCC 1A13808 TaxID=2602738 RepID=UPI0012ECB5DB|nr:MorD protein [Ketobacter sp. MCCC 1A13808]MVF13565.1 MorD protein [Ketobacter sp. MCCC 1A13808]
MSTGAAQATHIERSCTIVASALSDGRCGRVQLMSGERRGFGMNSRRTTVNIPYPAMSPGWSLRTWTSGIALQLAPSKESIAGFTLGALSARQSVALSIVEGGVALGWIDSRWPGLVPEIRRFLPALEMLDEELDGESIMDQAMSLAASGEDLEFHPILGQPPIGLTPEKGIMAALRRAQARAPWSTRKRYISPGYESIPAGGESNIKTSRLPSASRPEEDDIEISPEQRAGIPYPEWNMWTQRFLPNHVAVLERKVPNSKRSARPVSGDLKRWFEQRTHRVMRNRLEDGSDLDIDQYIEHHVNGLTGISSEARVFRDLQPTFRDVTTAVLLDGSASMGAGLGDIFKLELACADALCQAMALAKERHGLFIFGGKTRHRVDVTCLKDFIDPHSVAPSELKLAPGGYTRLGAPLRHLTSRLLAQPTERRLLIIIGDGLISDEGYEGRYAWADSAHAVEEAENAGVCLFYIGVGQTDVDPLPDVFGPRRSTRITQVEELPRVLSRVHRELVAA